MYLSALKTMLVEAIQGTFDAQYPVANFRDVHCSIEYPVEPQNYPGIWVDYDDTQPLVTAGVDHHEITVVGSTVSRYRRWKFTGYATFTMAALSSLERDRLFDEVVRVIAFGAADPSTFRFRQFIEDNDLIAANFNFDKIEVRGNAAMPGTPWGTDEYIYERTINMEVVGEFVSDAETGLLVPLSRILVDPPTVYIPADATEVGVPSEPAPDGWV